MNNLEAELPRYHMEKDSPPTYRVGEINHFLIIRRREREGGLNKLHRKVIAF